MPPIKLNIENANIYSNEPKITHDENDNNKFEFEQTFSIVSNKDYVIPPIELKYFNLNEQKIIILKTDEFHIDIKDEVKQEIKKIEVKENSNNDEVAKVHNNFSEANYTKYIFLVAGIIIGIFLSMMIKKSLKIKNEEKNITPLEKRIKKADDTNSLIKLLASYIRYDDKLDKILFELESNKNVDIKIKKKEIIKIVKSLNLKGM